MVQSQAFARSLTHALQQLEDEQSQQRRRKRAHVAAVERRRRHKQSNRVFASSLLRAHNLMARHMTAGRLAVARQEAEEEAALRRQEFEETKRARRIHASIAAQVGGHCLSVTTCCVYWFTHWLVIVSQTAAKKKQEAVRRQKQAIAFGLAKRQQQEADEIEFMRSAREQERQVSAIQAAFRAAVGGDTVSLALGTGGPIELALLTARSGISNQQQ